MAEQDRWLTSFMVEAIGRRAAEADAHDLRQVLLSFLEVLDSLDRLAALAVTATPQSGAGAPGWPDHLQALRQQLLEAFERADVTFFAGVGRPFNPDRQEAAAVVYRNDLDDYTVAEEIARGCAWRGEMLRFARVVVARRPG